MKLNNIENKDVDILELDKLYGLLLIKYPGEFEKKFAYDIANILYLNGIRAYMFFENKFDIDEIVYYIAYSRNKVKKICRKREYYYSDEDVNNGDTKSSQIISFNDYLKKNRSRK